MLEIKNLTVSYGYAPVLHEISLEVPDGKIVTLLGANGAGKTTTLKTISGILKPLSGEVILKGQKIDRLSPERIVKLGVSHVPEGRQVFPGLTVEENLKIGAFTNFSKKKDRKSVV